MQRYLKLDPYYYGNRHTFMLVNTHIDTMETLTTIALLIYGTYITTNTLRHRQRQHELAPSPTYIYDMLIQNIRNGATDHHRSMKILDNRWARNPLSTPIAHYTSTQPSAT